MDSYSSVFKQSFRQPDALLSYQEYSAFAALPRLPTHPGLSVEIAASQTFVCSSQWQLDRVQRREKAKNFNLPIDIVGRWCYNTVVVKTAADRWDRRSLSCQFIERRNNNVSSVWRKEQNDDVVSNVELPGYRSNGRSIRLYVCMLKRWRIVCLPCCPGALPSGDVFLLKTEDLKLKNE